MKNIVISGTGLRFLIGKHGEYNRAKLAFAVADLVRLAGSGGTFALLHEYGGEETETLATVYDDEKKLLYYTITADMTANVGDHRFMIEYAVADQTDSTRDKIAKSGIYTGYVGKSLA